MSPRTPTALLSVCVLTLASVLAVVAVALVVTAARAEPYPRPAAGVRLHHDIYGRLRAFGVRYRDLLEDHHRLVRDISFTYRAWDGSARTAILVLPRWYTPSRNPSLPLVISPHGRGIAARANVRFWGGMPAFGPFLVVNPEGQGRVLTRYSWGWRGEIDDLARMPRLIREKLPWVRIDRRLIYAVGSSMGGQETLLLVARHPRLLEAATALDSDTDMSARYRAFAHLRWGSQLQEKARVEIGGTPTSAPHAYAVRSPVYWASAIARSGVPLHIWWSRKDRIVRDQRDESGRLYRMLRALKPRAPVTEYVGDWAHSHEFHASARLPLALVGLDLIRLQGRVPRPDHIDFTAARAESR